jgi:hypothetical protein
MSQALAPLVWTVSALLIVAGAGKLRAPRATGRALRDAELPAHVAIARGVGAAELAAGGACLVHPAPASCGAVALAYMGFAWFILRLRRRNADADCGCFGERAFTPGGGHAALNLGAGTAGLLAGLSPPPGIGAVAARAPLEAIAVGLGAVATVWLAYLVFTALPEAWGAYRGGVDGAA